VVATYCQIYARFFVAKKCRAAVVLLLCLLLMFAFRLHVVRTWNFFGPPTMDASMARDRRTKSHTLAQSFSPFLARDGRQVCCPSWIWATSLCYILLNKFVALVGSGRQTCRPSCNEKGLEDCAIRPVFSYLVLV
jgi:hypothetical protein